MRTPPGMSLIVRTIARVATVFILIFGCYVLMTGHHGPGGGVAFGVILALAFMLVLLAFGREVASRFISRRVISAMAALSMLAFLAVGLLGYLGSKTAPEGKFFLNFLPVGKPSDMWSGGTAPLCDLAIGFLLGAVIFGVLTSLSAFHSRQRQDPSEPKEK